ncbi:hypothetical protein D3C76_1506190 [compost metagenome]
MQSYANILANLFADEQAYLCHSCCVHVYVQVERDFGASDIRDLEGEFYTSDRYSLNGWAMVR